MAGKIITLTSLSNKTIPTAVIHLMELSLFADPEFHFQFRLSILWNLFQTKFRVLSSPLWQYCTQMSNERQIGKLNLRTSIRFSTISSYTKERHDLPIINDLTNHMTVKTRFKSPYWMIVLVETIKSCKQILYQDKGTMPKERQCSLYLSPQWRRDRGSFFYY